MNYQILKVANLSKIYKNKIQALSDITFFVSKGEIFGLIGPDGAGKTTLIRCLCGALRANNGTIEIFGKNLYQEHKNIIKDIGYLSQRFSLYGDLTVEENIDFFASIREIDDYESRKKELLKKMSLTNFTNRLAKDLSGGMKQKLALICSLIYNPKIIFLDEPTSGVDPISRREFWNILSDLKKEGITILIATAYLDEAERCDSILAMNEGKTVMQGKLIDILKSQEFYTIVVYADKIRVAKNAVSNIFSSNIFGDKLKIISYNINRDILIIEEKLKKLDLTFKIEIENPDLESVF
jgi:ABC-2 type transport system ATP-binding protein